jgi:hypothetical protein
MPLTHLAAIDSRRVQSPTTQTIRLRWLPVLRFYEERITILRGLEERGLLKAFRVSEETVEAELPGWRWLSVAQSGITLDVLTETPDALDGWSFVDEVVKLIGPLHFTRARVSYQHVLALPFPFEEAVGLAKQRLYRGLGTPEVEVGDWALLADLNASGPPASVGQSEIGVIHRREVDMRLKRSGGRGPGMQHLFNRAWDSDAFKEASLFADSDLVLNADEDSSDTFLDHALTFWGASCTQTTRLVEDFRSKLVGESDGGSNG